jgi:hypothetical protein
MIWLILCDPSPYLLPKGKGFMEGEETAPHD